MTKSEKELIEEKFIGLTKLMNAQFTNVHERLDSIEKQTTKTNGRVTELEHKELTKYANCPRAPQIDKINEDLAEYKLFKKYPKIGIAIVAAAVLMFLITTFTSIDKIKTLNNKENIEILKETGKRLNDTLDLYNF